MATETAKSPRPRRRSRGRSPTPKRITSSRKTPERRNRSSSRSADGRFSAASSSSSSSTLTALYNAVTHGRHLPPSLPLLSRAFIETLLLATSLGLTVAKDLLNRKILQKHVTSQHVMDGFATTLTACQYSFVAVVLWTLRGTGVVTPKRFPAGRRRMRLALIAGTALAPLASNFALLLNQSARTYQSLRAAQTLLVAVGEVALGYGRIGILGSILLVGITIATAVQISAGEGLSGLSLAGVLPTALTLVLPPLFNVGAGALIRDGWSPLQLLYSVFPWSAMIVLVLAALQDDFAFVGILTSLDTQVESTPLSDSLALLVASSFFAFLALLSQLVVLGGTSPVKYSLLWHLNSALALLFSSSPAARSPTQRVGATVTVALVLVYFVGSVLRGGREGKKKRQ